MKILSKHSHLFYAIIFFACAFQPAFSFEGENLKKKRTLDNNYEIVSSPSDSLQKSKKGGPTLNVTQTVTHVTDVNTPNGSVIFNITGGTGPYTTKRVLFKDGFGSAIDQNNFTATTTTVGTNGTDLQLETVEGASWNSRFVSNTKYNSVTGLTFSGTIFIPYDGYKATMIGFHDGLENSVSSVAHGIYFFDNGTTSPVGIQTRENGNAVYMSPADYTNNVGFDPGRWFDWKVKIEDTNVIYSVKPSEDAVFTNISTIARVSTASPLEIGVRGTSNSVTPNTNYTLHKNWVLTDNEITSLAAGTHTYSITDANGDEEIVTVTVLAIPSVTSSSATLITSNSATLNGDVTSDGNSTITERGFVYSLTSTDSSPTVAESSGSDVTKVVVSGTTGSFNQAISSLMANSGYSFASYAINAVGTTEGAVQTFTTLNTAPTFTSTEVTSVDEGNTYTYTITTNDADGDNVTLTAPTKPSWLNLVNNISGDVTTFAGSGSSGNMNGNGTNASFNALKGVVVDPSGNVYVADTDNRLIRKITPNGDVTTFAGSGGYGSVDGNGISASFSNPYGIGIDASGNLYVAELGSHSIRKITPSGDVTTLAGSGSVGSANGNGNSASFSDPQGVAIDASGNVYVADTNNHKIRKITPSGDVTTYAGSGSQGSTDANGTSASFSYPRNVAIDASGNLYVVDQWNHKIRKIANNGDVTTYAGSGSQGSTNANGTSASFYYPYGIAIDASGNLYVTDQGNQIVRKIASNGDVITLAGSGVGGSIDANGTSASFNFPYGIAVDAIGNVYVADQNSNKVRKISSASKQLTGDSSGQVGNHNIVLTANDGNGGTVNQSFTVTVNDITAPEDPMVTAPTSAVTINAATGTVSGTHTENGVTVHAYLDANNDGTADNTTSLGSSIVSGNTWSFSVNLVADTANNIVVKAIDTSNNESNDVDVPTVTEDSTSPTVLEVTSATSNGTYGVGDVISITVQYDEEVVVTGTPQLTLETGATDRVINYVSRSVSTILFSYTVQSGDESLDLDVLSSSALALNGSTMKDLAGNDASLTLQHGSTLGSLSLNKNIVINASVPTVTTNDASSIVQFSSYLGGNVTDAGGSTVTERGIIYVQTALNGTPIIGGFGVTKATIGSGTGSFGQSITGLAANTGYSFRAYAVNNSGTVYGAVKIFTTLALVAPTITFGDINKTYDDPNVVLNVSTGGSFGVLSYSIIGAANGNLITGINNNELRLGDIGTATIRVTVGAQGIYTSGTKDATITIIKKAITVTADSGQSKIYGGTDPTFTYSVTSGSLASGDVFSGELSRPTGENVGNYTITQGTLSAGGNYTLTYASKGFNITKKSIEVTAAANQSKIYGDNNPAAYTYSITSGSLETGDSFTGALSRNIGEDVGTYTINVATLTAGGNYSMAYISKDFSITKRPITVSTDTEQAKAFGNPDPVAYTYAITVGTVVNGDTPTGALTRSAGEFPGTYPISIGTLSYGANYNVTYVGRDFTIAFTLTGGVAAASATKATVIGESTNQPGLIERGVVYSSVDMTPEVGEPNVIKVVDNILTGPFEVTITGLNASTNYYFQTYVIANTSRGGKIAPELYYGGVKNFATAVTEPIVTSYSPTDGSLLVDPITDLTITFDQNVQQGTGSFEIRKSSDDSLVETIDVASGNVDICASVVTINPVSDLPQLTDLYILAPVGIVQNTSTQNWAGTHLKTEWNFQSDDTVVPMATATSPTDDATNVPPADNLTVTFDENVGKGTGNILVKSVSDDSVIATLDVASSEVSITNNVVTINPNTDLPGGTAMYLEVASGVFEDQYNNAYAGIAGNSAWNFTTAVISAAFDVTSSNGLESVSSVNIPVTLSVPLSVTATMDYTITGTATGSGSDYTLANGTLTFNAGSTSENITIAGIVDDAILESDETVIITLSNPVNTTLGANTIYIYTITNNDVAAVTIADISANEDDGAITVTATLDNAVQGGLTISVSTADGSATLANNDYTAIVSENVSFTGTAGETQTFTVIPLADTTTEFNEELTVSMQLPKRNTSTIIDVSDTATVTITNDDLATITIEDVSGNEDDGAITLTATLDNDIQDGVTIAVSTSDGTATLANNDYTAIVFQHIAFTGTAGETQTFTVTPTADAVTENDETISVFMQLPARSTLLIADVTDTATVTILDDDAPVVTAVSRPTDGVYGIGQGLDFTVTFSSAVSITGSPSLPITIGSTTLEATLNGTVSNATTANFKYTVVEGNLDTDGVAVGTDISLNGGTIEDASNRTAILALNNVASTVNVNVDGVKPTVVITSNAADPTNIAITATFTFSEDVTGFDVTDIDVGNGTASNLTGSGAVYTATITPTADGGVTVLVFEDLAQDAATNGNDVSNEFFVEYDATNPTIAITTTAVSPVNAPFDITMTFSEDVTGFDVSDVVVTNGTISNFVATSASVYTALITPTAEADITVDIAAATSQDAATNGNDATQFIIEYDSTPPNPPQLTHISDYTCVGNVTMTGDNTLEISGIAEEGSTIEVFENGTSIGTTITTNAGFFTFDHTGTTLADGTYSFTVTATDIANNTSPLSAALTITINSLDTDGDGLPDFCDDDKDGNGVDDVDEDCDGDGIVDHLDTDNSACTSTITQTKSYGFSPNGDGVNDGWVIDGITAYPNSLVQVFNRSGKLVFKKKGYQNDWTGISNQIASNGTGTRLPVGPYLFIIDLGNGTQPTRGWIYINY